MDKPLIKRPEPVLNPNNPFCDDILGREGLADSLTTLVSDTEESVVIALNGGWGTGKTFFLDRWAYKLQTLQAKGTNPCVIQFNAWQDDDVEDPLLALVGQIHKYLHAHRISKDPKISEDFSCKLERFASEANRLLSIGAKHVSHSVDHKIGVDVYAAVSDIANYQAKRVEQYEDAIKARVDVKERLRDLASAVRKESGFPLVVIVDDLDRCKPSFAISLLERIKHLFSVPGIVFVLGVDQNQLSCTLRNVYGEGFDAQNYLYRLFDVELFLPKPKLDAYVKSLMSQYTIDDFIKKSALKKDADYIESTIDEFKAVASYLAERHNMSLREVDRLIREVSIVLRLCPIKTPVLATLTIICIVLRMRWKSLYGDLVSGDFKPHEVVDTLIGVKPIRPGYVYNAESHITSIVYACTKNSNITSAITNLANELNTSQYWPKDAPKLFSGNQRRVLGMLNNASTCNITHNDVKGVDNALAYLRKWNDGDW